MSVTWILVADRAGAKVFEHRTRGGHLALLQDIAHPEGRLESHELGTDRPGRTGEGNGGASSGFAPHHAPTEDVAHAFAARLGGVLLAARNEHQYEKVILVAEPRFLGALRGALDHATTATVAGSLDKDLMHASLADIEHHLAHLLNAM